MTRRKQATRKQRSNPVLPRNSMERIEDTAFEHRVRVLTERRRWAELQAAFMMHGSTLTDREQGRGKG